jgi:ribosomal protein S18 acetylase RimI-like enzyme
LALHADVCVAFRVDSYVVSFGSAELFGDPDRYLAVIGQRSADWPGSIVHVWHANEIIGQLELRREPDDPDTGYVNLFYLVPARRGTGLGQALHDYVLDFFGAAGLRRAALSVSPTNERALRYYNKHGWVDRGPDPAKAGRVHRMERDLEGSRREPA